jgi:hypothetical protein
VKASSAILLVLGVIVSIVIAWVVVDVALHLLFFLVKAAIVLVVAAIVFVVLWVLVRRRGSRS